MTRAATAPSLARHVLRWPLLAVAFFVQPARADERILPTPRVTLYPGDAISEEMLEQRAVFVAPDADDIYVGANAALVGQVARRTLPAGRPIQKIAVGAAKIVNPGAAVRLVFSQGGLVITAYGVALQAGAVGDLIRARNSDSGVTVAGHVTPEGAIRVSEE